VLPDRLAGGGVQANDALVAGVAGTRRPQRLAVRAEGSAPVHDVNAAGRDGGPAVARAQRRPPEQLRSALGEFVDQAGLTPDAVALGAEPLGPVVRPGPAGRGHGSRDREQYQRPQTVPHGRSFSWG